MSRLKDLVSTEAIDYQHDTILFKEMALIIKEMQSEPNANDSNLDKYLKRLAGVINTHTGLSFKITLDPSTTPNAWIFAPEIDKNNPLFTNFHRDYMSSDQGLRLVNKNNGVIKGTVDREKVKVTGVFTELSLKMSITNGLVGYNGSTGTPSFFTPEEVAAIISHEIGHIFTYFEFLGTTITTNYVLQHVSRSLLETRETKRKYQIIKEGSDALGIKIEDPDALINTQKEEVIQTVLLREVAIKRHEELGSNTYDLTAWEMLSDQFANRLGGGRALITALDKIYKRYGDDSYMSKSEYFYSQLIKSVGIIIFTPFTLGLLPIMLFFVINPDEDLYDKPKARMLRIQRDMTDVIKNQNLSKKQKDTLIEDIERVDLVIKQLESHRTWIQAFWRTFNRKARKQYQQMVFQQELEILANNRLFVQAAKLNQLA